MVGVGGPHSEYWSEFGKFGDFWLHGGYIDFEGTLGTVMGRPRKDELVDLSRAHDITVGMIERLACPVDREQVFLRSSKVDGLRVRCTRAGAKSWVYESKVAGRTFRRTIGPVTALTIDEAGAKALTLAALVKVEKVDPREVDRERAQAQAQTLEAARLKAERLAAEQAAREVKVSEAWAAYLSDRQPLWRERTYRDHVDLAHLGGETRKRSDKLTKPGPLAALMNTRLVDLTDEAVREWARVEAAERPARARLALRLLKAFLRWASAEPAYRDLTDPAAASGKKTREVVGSPRKRNDCLQREQLKAWFSAVRALPNAVVSAYFQILLLTGARREELARLRWEDINFRWKGIRLADKVHDEGREIPLTPFVEFLLSNLPRRNEWVFASVRAVDQSPKGVNRRSRYHAVRGSEAPAGDMVEVSASGRITDPSDSHRRACAAAGIDGLTLHGLRRSFASLCEWLEIPGGVSAQIQGHAPQGVREQNYIRRPLDLLRVHHEAIERWMLQEAGIDVLACNQKSRLRVASKSGKAGEASQSATASGDHA